MEGGDTVAQDKSEQTASSGAVNGESLAVDMKETVVLNEDGSELVVNGGSTEGGPDDSLDTETQTKEDEFPPDDLIGGEMAQPKQNGTMESKDETRPDEVQEVVNGRDLPSENPLGVEENGLEESSRGGEEESPEGVEAQSGPINEETGLRSINSGDSYVKSAVKLREKKGSKVNSHVVKQSRVSFVEQELIRQKQQEEEFRREREQRTQDIQHHGKAPVPPPAARVKSPQPPAAKAAPAKPTKSANSKAKAIYQELNYNPKTGGNRSTAMAKDWENKFEK